MSIEDIRDALSTNNSFWETLHHSFNALGFTDAYIRRLAPVPTSGRPKYVKDKLWGMMEFTPDELAIIDSPLLQRLRRIGQLGLTFLTYPSAEHSRFAHTLGVAHVVKRLINSISDIARREPVLRADGEEYFLYDPKSDPDVVRSLTHAALLHDVGHFAFSHAGEIAFSSLADEAQIGGFQLAEFIGIFREANFDSGLSECLSIAVCLSPRFRSFYGKVTGEANLDRRLRDVCSFIGGVAHDPLYPGLANLISGAAVDADKIDYLNRDASECGIPVGVDVSRVFLNSALVRVDERQALALSRSRGHKSEGSRFVPGTHFIVNSSGIDTYDELANAKSVLYDRVYLHQLTRNAEQVLSHALHAAMRSAQRNRKFNPLDVLSWFQFGDDELLAWLSNHPTSKRMATRLISRDLPKRAFVLFRDVCEPFVKLHEIFDPLEWGGPNGPSRLNELETVYYRRTAWRLFDQIVPVDETDRPRRLAELRENILREAVAAKTLLNSRFLSKGDRAGEPYVGISPRLAFKPINEVLVREKNSIGHSGQWTRSEELANADNIGRGVDYIHADREWCLYVAIACAKVLYNFFADNRPLTIPDGTEIGPDIETPGFAVRPRLLVRLREICSRTGVDYAELVAEMSRADKLNYFEAAHRIVPLGDTEARECQAVAEHYAKFSGERGWRVSEGSVRTFVRQFPVGLRPEMLQVLRRGTVIGRGATREAMDALTAKLGGGTGAELVIARFSPNSGAFTGMTLEQERKGDYERLGHEFVRTIGEFEARLENGNPPACLMFVDDQFATGGQAHGQLLHWGGKQRDEWPVEIRDERNIDQSPLGPKTKEFLKRGKIRLAFLQGTETGKLRIEKVASELGFADLKVEYDTELLAEPAGLSDALKEFLRKVGYQLLKSVRYGEDDLIDETQQTALHGDELGYGNIGSVMVTPSSAPSHTITALWCPGTFERQPWIPIFLRRGYRKHLVLG
jgi:HD superfamily phosphohydrolase